MRVFVYRVGGGWFVVCYKEWREVRCAWYVFVLDVQLRQALLLACAGVIFTSCILQVAFILF